MELRDLGFLLSLSPLLACVIDVEDAGDSGFGGNTTEPVQANADGPVCGNGVIEAGEACDSDNFGEVTCESLALGTGQLSCSDECEIVAAACEEFMGGTTGDDGGANTVSASGASASASATAADTAPNDDGYAESYGYDGYATSLGDDYGDYGDDGIGKYSPTCAQYGQAAANCYGGDPNEYASFCQYNFEYYASYGPACSSALEDYYACLSGTPCGQFGLGCDAELTALDNACF